LQSKEGYHFVVITDHQALPRLKKIINPSGCVARWSIEMSQWDYEVRHRKISKNVLADSLSRDKRGVTAVDLKCFWYFEKYQEMNNKLSTITGRALGRMQPDAFAATTAVRQPRLCNKPQPDR
jgi:hypothetical protein